MSTSGSPRKVQRLVHCRPSHLASCCPSAVVGNSAVPAAASSATIFCQRLTENQI
jgi:hypothetical protein